MKKKRRDFTEIVVSDYEKYAVLSKSPLCRGMDRAELQFLAPFFHSYQVEEGALIYDEGDMEAFLCLIVFGAVDIVKGDDKVISTLGVGDTVGEMSIVDELPRSASAIAATTTVVYAITRSSLNEMYQRSLQTWSKFFMNIAVCLSLRLRESSDLLSQVMSTADTPQRPALQKPASFRPFLRTIANHDPDD